MTKEEIAQAAHDIWSQWMKQMFETLGKSKDEIIIDSESVEKWERLMNTPFEELTDYQKELYYEEPYFKKVEQHLKK